MHSYGSSDGQHFSAEYSFVSAPLVGPDTPVSIIAFADMGTSQCEMVKLITKPHAFFMLINHHHHISICLCV